MKDITINDAKNRLDKVIKKSRVHMYKPIQIAEILYKDRVVKNINVLDIETYRNPSKVWRDEICMKFLHRCSTSSSRYQDNIFEDNAIPPKILNILATVNKNENGTVEAYIYKMFQQKQFQIINALDYVNKTLHTNFNLSYFLNLFVKEPGLKRSVDKIFEIIVYALFIIIIKELEATIRISIPDGKLNLLNEFKELTNLIMGITPDLLHKEIYATIHRMGVTNASDRGLDLWSNFGPVIQIKHVSLTEKHVKDIVSSVNADKIVIVCKTKEKEIIANFIEQIGLGDKIQSIISEKTLIGWYEKALRGKFSSITGPKILTIIEEELEVEFPISNQDKFQKFYDSRYNKVNEEYCSSLFVI